jgi:putative Holliday junction resolvase
VLLALDWGAARIGVAACDSFRILAYPVATVNNDEAAFDKIAKLVSEYGAKEVILGLPVALNGAEEVAATTLREVAETLRSHLPDTPIRLVDERLTTKAAAAKLRESGKSTKKQRKIIDQAAAVALLESVIANQPPKE